MPGRAVALLSALVLFLVTLTAAGSGAAPGDGPMPSQVPSASTPGFGNGEVDSIVQIGTTVVAGGTFTNVTPPGGSSRGVTGLVAFDATSGQLVAGFDPVLNGTVEQVLPGPSAGTVYVAGRFSSVNGQAQSHVTLLNLSNGQVVNGFSPAANNGRIETLALAHGRLLIGGTFTRVGGQAHGGLASLNPSTGALDGWMDVDVSGHHNNSGSGAQGAVGARVIAVSGTAERIAVIGNFKQVDGMTRDQIVMLDASAGEVSVATDWRSRRYEPYCYNFAFDSYMRGMDASPDGSYFVVTTTGGSNRGTLCDSASRFEFDASGDNVEPTWSAFSGGDTLWGVGVTDNAVYVGGHPRWMNNPEGRDSAGAGAVPRAGLAALDPDSGIPLSWNPGRNPRGEAVYAIHATDSGLWIGSNTDWIGNRRYRRQRLAFFPLAGGQELASEVPASLPGSVYLAGSTPRTVAFDGSDAGTPQTADPRGVDWAGMRGAFILGDTLFSAHTDGYLHRRRFTTTETGPDERIDPYNDPAWSNVDTGSNNTYRGRVPSLYGQLGSLTGLFYDADRIYYTRAGQGSLSWRWFNADSGIVSQESYVVGGGRNWSDTDGLFLHDGTLYVVSAATGDLSALPFADGQPQGPAALVDDSLDWRANAVFIGPGGAQPPANLPPAAAMTIDCDELTCAVDASDSTDADGEIASYSWSFGDGAGATGVTAQHQFAEPGAYTITLEVVDNRGATGSSTRTIEVSETPAPPGAIGFRDSSSAAGQSTTPSVALPGGTQAGDLLLAVGGFQDDAQVPDPAGWTRAGEETVSGLRSVVWTRTATAADAGSSLQLQPSGRLKYALTVAAYSGAGGLAAVESSSDARTTQHRSPTLTLPQGSWWIQVWTDKSSSTTSWSPPNGVTEREQALGSGGGRITALYSDSGAPVAAGVVGGLTAVTNAASAKGIAWTLALSAP